jgi:hypothetical protein
MVPLSVEISGRTSTTKLATMIGQRPMKLHKHVWRLTNKIVSGRRNNLALESQPVASGNKLLNEAASRTT